MVTVPIGMVGIVSVHNCYLQAHDDDGEMHASNSNRHEEETWYLNPFDQVNDVYTIQNWKSRNYLWKENGICCRAIEPTCPDVRTHWRLIDGANYGQPGKVAIQSVFDSSIMGTDVPGNDTACGGEVAAGPATPESRSDWAGWWKIEPATIPSPGDIYPFALRRTQQFSTDQGVVTLEFRRGRLPTGSDDVIALLEGAIAAAKSSAGE